MRIWQLVSAAFIVVVALLCVPYLSAQAQSEFSSQNSITEPLGAPFWVDTGSLWFSSRSLGHELTTNEVKDDLQRWILASGNARLKVGRVVETDSNFISAEFVTDQNELVLKIGIDRHTGRWWLMNGRGNFWSACGIHGFMGWQTTPERPYGRMPLPFSGIAFFALFLFIAALLIVTVVRFQHTYVDGRSVGSSGSSPLSQLNALYAAGTISRDSYLKQKILLMRKG